MKSSERIAQHFARSQQALSDSLITLGKPIERAAEAIIDAFRNDQKLLICGNGGSASDAMHLSSELLNKYEMERPPLAAIALNADTSALTSIANDFAYEFIFSKQIEALGREHDVLLVLSTSGHSKNIIRAISAAHTRHMKVIALSGKDGGAIPDLLNPQDIELRVPNNETARIQEVHGLIIHCLCDLIDQQLFGAPDET